MEIIFLRSFDNKCFIFIFLLESKQLQTNPLNCLIKIIDLTSFSLEILLGLYQKVACLLLIWKDIYHFELYFFCSLMMCQVRIPIF